MTAYSLSYSYGDYVHPEKANGPNFGLQRHWAMEVEENQINFNNRTAVLESAMPVLDADEGADITDAIATLQASLTPGATIILPPRNYKLGKNVVGAHGITMIPDIGIHQVEGGTIQTTANDQRLFYYQAASPVTHMRISGARLLNTGGHDGCQAIHLDGVDGTKRISRVRIRNIDIEFFDDASAAGIYMSYCANSDMREIWITNCHNGIWHNICADSSLNTIRAQNGNNIGLYIKGLEGSQADEGYSITNFTTNGQAVPMYVEDQDWGEMVGCSLTTSTNTVLTLDNAENWTIGDTAFSPGAGVPYRSVVVNDQCKFNNFSGCKFIGGNYGVENYGEGTGISDCTFRSNSANDILLSGANSKYCTIIGNRSDSNMASAVSILEAGAADWNRVAQNVLKHAVTIVGANSQAGGNINYP